MHSFPGLLFAVPALLLLLATSLRSVAAAPQLGSNPASSSSSAAADLTRGPEAFFTNASSYVATSADLSPLLKPGRAFGLSFRSCNPGELLRQTGSRSLDQLRLALTARGRLALSLTTTSAGRVDAAAGEGLLDGRWHRVTVRVDRDKV